MFTAKCSFLHLRQNSNFIESYGEIEFMWSQDFTSIPFLQYYVFMQK